MEVCFNVSIFEVMELFISLINFSVYFCSFSRDLSFLSNCLKTIKITVETMTLIIIPTKFPANIFPALIGK